MCKFLLFLAEELYRYGCFTPTFNGDFYYIDLFYLEEREIETKRERDS